KAPACRSGSRDLRHRRAPPWGGKRTIALKKNRAFPQAGCGETPSARPYPFPRPFFYGLCFSAQLTPPLSAMLRWRDCRAVLFRAPAVVPGARCREARIGAPAQRNAMDYVAVANDEELRRQKL